MGVIKRMHEKYYTEKGIRALKNKMGNYIDLFNEHDFPFSAKMLGFGKFSIKTKDECLHRIRELGHLTGVSFKVVTHVSEAGDKRVEKQKIEVVNG